MLIHGPTILVQYDPTAAVKLEVLRSPLFPCPDGIYGNPTALWHVIAGQNVFVMSVNFSEFFKSFGSSYNNRQDYFDAEDIFMLNSQFKYLYSDSHDFEWMFLDV